MKVIGITGGIGSGKSTIASMLRDAGYPVFDCDFHAKSLYNSDKDVISDMKKLFGENIYKDSLLDRKALADIVFKDKISLEKLNSVIHPKVREFMSFQIKESKSDLFFIESAILFESGLSKYVDKVLTVTAPVGLRIERTIKRDNTTEEKVRERMKFQICEDRRLFKSDYVISTDQDLTKVKEFLFRLVQNMK
jgi:dephospho-CoA kinase